MKRKSVVSILLAMAMVFGIAVVPTKAAEPSIPNAVYYEEDIKIADYWTKDTTDVNEVPTSKEEGYFFGGWFQKNQDGTYTALKEADLVNADLSTLNACAKFVPSYLFSVKAQIEKKAQDSDGTDGDKTYLRLITGLDSNEYQKVNFHVWYNNRIEATSPDITTVYSKMENADGTLEPKSIFGDAANYFGVVRLTEIMDVNYSKTIYARPYITTMDGTVVWGNAKYVRVEDGFKSNKYISIPVNLHEGSDMAVGSLSFYYDNTTLDVKDVTIGRLLDEMEYSVDEKNGVIKFILHGVADENGAFNNVTPDGLYANVRFQKKGTAAKDLTHWNFNASEESFCNWEEEILVGEKAVKAWDVRY